MVCLKLIIIVCYHYILYTLYRAAPTEARQGEAGYRQQC